MEIKTQADLLLALEMVQKHLKDIGHFSYEDIVFRARKVLTDYAKISKIFCCGNELVIPEIIYESNLGWPSVLCPKCSKIFTISFPDEEENEDMNEFDQKEVQGETAKDETRVEQSNKKDR